VAVGDTVAWLDAVSIPYRDLCFLGTKPQVEADCYVDDAPHNVRALRAIGAQVIVFDRPYNRDLDGPRATNWPEVEQLVGEQMAAEGIALQTPLPGFEDTPNRLHRRLQS
jgi:5'(3')-deoxyribonucleotidase